jgi:hypothetical protein
MPIRRELEIGGVAVTIGGVEHDWAYSIGHAHRYFASDRAPDVTIEVLRLEQHLQPTELQLVAVSQETDLWRMYAMGDGFAIQDRAFGPSPPTLFARWSLFDASFGSGQVYLAPEAFQAARLFPLHYQLDFLLVANYLARNGGMLLHASAVSDGGQGMVFAGPSGSGKSTLADLWRAEDWAQVLNQDLVALRQQEDGGITVHGTPWWTEDPTLCSPLGVPIRAICFIAHGTSNCSRLLSKSDAVLSLVAQCVSPIYYDAGLTSALIDFCTTIAETIPVYHLEFRPDSDIIEFVCNL